jgi:GH43 family beta-xylosidase
MSSIKILFGRMAVLVALILTSAAVILSLSSAALAQTATFQNPLNTSRGADPWMLYYNGNYYLAATTWSSDPNVGLTMKKATTIAGLKAATPQRIFFDTTSNRCCNIWAPEFHLMNGPNGQRWYLYYVAGVAANTDSQRIHVAESAGLDPMGPYTYRGTFPAGGPTDAWAVDPTIMTINGQYYMFYSSYEGVHYQSSQNIYGVALSNPWTQSGSRALIARPTFTWETGTAAVNEAPVQLTAPNGTIYLVFSATWCGNPNYQLGRATYTGGNVLSQSSWSKFNGPIFTRGNGQSSTAHNGFFKSPDGTEDWLVYHGVNNTNGDCGPTLRTTRIQKFTWNADNTPNMGVSVALTTNLNVPSGEGGVGPTPTRTRTPTPGGPTPTRTPTPQAGSGPVHWYQFNGNANDSGSSVQNGTLVNGPTFVTGQNGQAVNLDGSNDHVTLPAGIVNGMSNFWVKLDTTGAWRRIFDFGTGTTVNMFLVPTSGSSLRFAITTGGNGAEQQINGPALATGVWKHVAITKNGNTGTMYVDGVQVAQNTNMTLGPSSLGNTTQNYIGRSQYPDPYLDGQIDQFRIYNRALSASEILALFQTP